MSRNKNHTLLWELLPPNGAKSSYLFGTIHLPDKSLFRRIPAVKECLQTCDAFMAEYRLNEDQQKVQEAFYLDEDHPIDSYLTDRKFKRIRKQLKKSFQLDINQYRFIKPLVLENMLAAKFLEEAISMPMDMLLYEFAEEQGKILLGAESLSSQVKILEKFPVEIQIKNLLKLSRNPSRYSKMIRRIKKYYLEENIKGLYKISLSSLGKMKRILVYDRNHKMALSIIENADEMSIFCAVGAGHLYGKSGLLRLLKLKGFGLKPIYQAD